MNTYVYIGWGKSRFTVVHIEKDMKVMIITTALLTVFHMPTTVNLLFPLDTHTHTHTP